MAKRRGLPAAVAAAWLWGVGGAGAQDFAASLSAVRDMVRQSASTMGVEAFTSASEPGESREDRRARRGDRRASREDERQARIYRGIEPSMVVVRTPAGNIGSGFIVDAAGLVMTNAHVVEGSAVGTNVTVEFFDGTSHQARVEASARGRDVALVRIAGPRRDWPAVRFGDSGRMVPGYGVFAVGNPTDLGISFSRGMISRSTQDRLTPWVDHIQSDLQIHPGNSGGPLLDSQGRVVGMNTMIAGMGGRLAMSIPGSVLQSSLQEFQRDGALVDGDFGASLARQPSGPPFVVAVPGAQARAGSVRVGDTPLRVDGTEVTGTGADAVRAVRRAFARGRPGETTIELRVRRAIAASLVLPPETEGGAERAAAAHIINSAGLVFLPAGNPAFVAASAAPGAAPKIRVGTVDYDVELAQASATGFAIFRIPESAAWTGTFETADLRVRVDRYTP